MKNYSSQDTAILIVDPYNDFLSEGGKLWPITKETVNGVNLVENLKNQNSYLRKVILLLNTIGLPAALQIQILIFYSNYTI
jgi:hypothetical protein